MLVLSHPSPSTLHPMADHNWVPLPPPPVPYTCAPCVPSPPLYLLFLHEHSWPLQGWRCPGSHLRTHGRSGCQFGPGCQSYSGTECTPGRSRTSPCTSQPGTLLKQQIRGRHRTDDFLCCSTWALPFVCLFYEFHSFNPSTPISSKRTFSTFYREMYRWGSESWWYNHLSSK